jgi:hypothetical protein
MVPFIGMDCNNIPLEAFVESNSEKFPEEFAYTEGLSTSGKLISSETFNFGSATTTIDGTNPDLLVDSRFTLLKTEYAKVNKVSPLKLHVKFSEDVSIIDLYLGRGRYNDGTDFDTGFGDDTADADANLLICYAENITSGVNEGCRIIYYSAETDKIHIKMSFDFVLLQDQDYTLVIDKINQDTVGHTTDALKGITFPTAVGKYLITLDTDSRNHDSVYLDIYPEEFPLLDFWSHIPIQGEKNWFEVKFQPVSDFSTLDYLVLEIPLDSNE